MSSENGTKRALENDDNHEADIKPAKQIKTDSKVILIIILFN